MTVEEAYKILTNQKMKNLNCNFKITSKRKITLEDVINEMHKGFDTINLRIDNLETRIGHLDKRINHLVKVNNLKE